MRKMIRTPNLIPWLRRQTVGAIISLLALLAATPALADGGQPWIDRVVAVPYPLLCVPVLCQPAQLRSPSSGTMSSNSSGIAR